MELGFLIHEAQVHVHVAACNVGIFLYMYMSGGFSAVAGSYSRWITPGDAASVLNKPPSNYSHLRFSEDSQMIIPSVF